MTKEDRLELIEHLKYSRSIGADYAITDEDVDEIIKALEQTRWIPVSERLPKGSEMVLLSLPPRIEPNSEECSASVICGHYIGSKNAEWGLSDGETFGYGIVSVRKGINPIAWMPLPEPYKAESEGKE